MNFAQRWRMAWKLPAFSSQFIWSTTCLLVILVLSRILLEYVEVRDGIVLNDPLLVHIAPTDLRWLTWTMTYSGILFGLVSISFDPFMFLLSVRALIAATVLRMACLLVLPLDPPAGIIPLVDPLVQLPFVEPVLTRDLFFSWHTAVISLFAFVVPGKDMKIIFASLAGLVAVSLLIQHAQYTISVLTAPCFAYAALGFARSVTLRGQPGFGSMKDYHAPGRGRFEGIAGGNTSQAIPEPVSKIITG